MALFLKKLRRLLSLFCIFFNVVFSPTLIRHFAYCKFSKCLSAMLLIVLFSMRIQNSKCSEHKHPIFKACTWQKQKDFKLVLPDAYFQFCLKPVICTAFT
jgi:hypothetical protein